MTVIQSAGTEAYAQMHEACEWLCRCGRVCDGAAAIRGAAAGAGGMPGDGGRAE